MTTYDLDHIRSQIIGNNLVFDTPFGERNILYADYTASGRGVKFIEEKLQNILCSYANTHTEDDYSGKYLTQLFKDALKTIKKHVNAGKTGKVISVGSGSTGALKKLQEIIGIYIPPVTRERIFQSIEQSGIGCEDIQKRIETDRPVVFIGPYEHHTNELMWREAFVEVVVIGLDSNGRLDLDDLSNKVADKNIKGRCKIASFSAGSNITGIRTDVYDIAKICHDHDCLIFYDFAAVAPYVEIVQKGLLGLKPGWVRINIHYTFSKKDVDFLARAIAFIAKNGHLFLPKYVFNIQTGEWTYYGFPPADIDFGIEHTFQTKKVDMSQIDTIRNSYFQQAESLFEELRDYPPPYFATDNPEIEELKTFYYCS